MLPLDQLTVGQLTAFVPSHFLEVPRSGDGGRFQPVKDPDGTFAFIKADLLQ